MDRAIRCPSAMRRFPDLQEQGLLRLTRADRAARFFDWPVMIAALLVIPTIILESVQVSHPWRIVANVADWAIWIVFAAELIVMIAVVPHRGVWVRQHPISLAVVVLTPPFAPAALQIARVLRLLRLLRLARTAQLARRLFSLEGVRYVSLIAFLVIIGGGVAFSEVEKAQHLSAWDGVWWAVTTVTTVGGNIEPHTTTGRLIATAVICVGLAVVALLTAAAADRFISHKHNATEAGALEAELQEQILERLSAIEADLAVLRERS